MWWSVHQCHQICRTDLIYRSPQTFPFTSLCTSVPIALIYAQSSFHHDSLQWYGLMKIAHPPLDTLIVFVQDFLLHCNLIRKVS